jgi:Raf kinase inhibitor-like YbhB/YbcL family protein
MGARNGYSRFYTARRICAINPQCSSSLDAARDQKKMTRALDSQGKRTGRVLLLITAVALGAWARAASKPASHFVLSGVDPKLAARVPEVYTANAFGCSGGNTSPALQWSGAPPGTLSFVVTLFDPDERSTPSGWWHWVVYDLPKDSSRLALGAGVEKSTLLPEAAQQGRSDLGNDDYHGPCPAKGDPPHRYTFTIYALNVAQLPVPAESSGAMVTSTAQEHLFAKAVFIAHYGR